MISFFEGKRPDQFGFKEIIYEKKGWMATVTINRPDVYNAYSTQTIQEMTEAFKDVMVDDGIAVLVLTGAGQKAFCTGGDVKEYADVFTQKPRDYWKWMNLFIECHEVLRNLGKPTIARINGIVAGGGNEFNMACDLAVMADHATIRQVGPRVGSVACGGATQWLPLMVGDRRAREILYFCDEVSAQKALEWGLVNAVAPYPDLDKIVGEWTRKLVDKFPECLRYTKEQVNFWKNLGWYQTVGHARDWLSLHFATYEPLEGMKAFVEKRKPDYLKLRTLAKEGKNSEFPWGAYLQKCPACKASYLPQQFTFCGVCGEKLT